MTEMPSKPRIGVIGDSTVARGALAYEVAASKVAGFDPACVEVNGYGGRPLTTKPGYGAQTAPQAIAEVKAKLGGVDVWVVSLGINSAFLTDDQFRTQVGQLMDLMPGRVHWYLIRLQRAGNTNAARLNPIIRDVVTSRDNGHVIDFGAYLEAGMDSPDFWLDPSVDITHNSAEGYALRAAYGMGRVAAA